MVNEIKSCVLLGFSVPSRSLNSCSLVTETYVSCWLLHDDKYESRNSSIKPPPPSPLRGEGLAAKRRALFGRGGLIKDLRYKLLYLHDEKFESM